jgi:hypothetical protein
MVLSSPTDSTSTLANSIPYKLELKNCVPFNLPLHVQRVLLPGAVHAQGAESVGAAGAQRLQDASF